MGATRQGPSERELLHQRAARRDVGRFNGSLRHLFRHHRRAGLLLGRFGRKLATNRARFAGCAVRRSANTQIKASRTMVSKAAEGTRTVRVVLPFHLRMLAKIAGELQLEVEPPVTQRAVLDALEARYPMLSGTTRDHVTQRRRAYLRFYACEQDLSLEEPDTPLPDAVAEGEQPFLIIGAIAGG